MRQGDLFWAELRPRSGSEQQGRRPVIIVSHDGFNETPGWGSLIVIPGALPESDLLAVEDGIRAAIDLDS